ncbi:YdcF family protein [Salidesulfovibrio brasiliensis]|uniref:YdcF family protein n=1 Tax=Salidesulfovibrio brasiliensis TaxID=221711 RepID=UPI0006D15028|nr:YdcF family protein [Salidesulfovibrio brasiliensis]
MKKLAEWFFKTLGFLTFVVILVGTVGFFAMGHWLQLDEKPQQADYVLPLAGDYLRLMRGVELMQEGYAPTLLLSKAKPQPKTRFDLLRDELGWRLISDIALQLLIVRHMGLDLSRVEEFGDGHISTVEEAEALKRHLNGKPARLLVVTSPTHARRAKIILEDILPNCEIIMTATPEDRFPAQWWKDQSAAQNIVMESAKLIHYWLGGAFRSTDAPI